MRSLFVAASLALVLGAAPVFGQAPAPAPQTPPPAQQQDVTPPPQPPAPFPQGAKVAFVNLQAIAQLSVEGKAAATKVNELGTQRANEVGERTKAIQALQQKLQAGAGVMTDTARAQLEREVERLTRDLERFQQDAQVELNDLQVELQNQFQEKLFPILEGLADEHQLHFLFSAADAGLIWAAEGLDLTLEAVSRLDAATAPKP
jgi:Skp family chaperone for outer membrane proteins